MWKAPLLHLEWSLIKTALALVMLAGCSTAPPVAPNPEPRPLGSDLGAYRAPRIGAEGFEGTELLASVEPKGTLMLGEALALALKTLDGAKGLPMVVFLTDGLPTIGETNVKKGDPVERGAVLGLSGAQRGGDTAQLAFGVVLHRRPFRRA